MLTLYVNHIYRTDHNNLNGAIPSEIGDLTELRYFSFSKSCYQLKNIDLQENAKTTIIDSGNNKLEGAIPSELGKLIHLESLQIGRF